jgi:hypothetical protein
VPQPDRSGQGLQPPPQSTPVSAPFSTPSLHVGAAHAPPAHTRDAQSAATAQAPSVGHPAHVPPQSVAVS